MMLRTIFLTILVFIVIALAGIGFYNYPDVKLTAEKAKADFFPKEKIYFRITLDNNGLKNSYFILNIKSGIKNPAPVVLYLASKMSKDIDYSMEIPSETPPGRYNIEITASLPRKDSFPFKMLAHENLLFDVQEPPPPPVVKKIQPVTGKIKFVSLPDNFNYNTNYFLKTAFKNTTDRKSDFILSLNITAPDSNTWVSSHTLTLASGENDENDFQFFTDRSFAPGKYSLTLGLYDKNSGKPLSSDSQIINLVDNPPVIELNTMYDKQEKKFDFVGKISDDIAVHNVQLHFSDLTSGYATNYSMALMSGSEQNGIWGYTIELNKKIRKSSFYVTALDSRNQKTQTETFNISSFLEK